MSSAVEAGTVEHWIGGAPSTDAEQFGEVTDPATGAITKRVPFAGAADVAEAIARARDGFARWGSLSLGRRANVMFAFRELLRTRRDELAALITAEHGKTLPDAAGEVQRGLEVVDFACGLPDLLKGEPRSRSRAGSTPPRCGSRWRSWSGSRRSTSP